MQKASFISEFEDDCNSYKFDISNGSLISTDNFIIVHYNMNSILAQVRSILKIDILIITESKLDQIIPTNLITIPWQICWCVLMYIIDNLVLNISG